MPVTAALAAGEAAADGAPVDAAGEGVVAGVPRQAETTSGIGTNAASSLRNESCCIIDLLDSIERVSWWRYVSVE